ncbi:hypothetical protein HK098_006678 [Nowakowskiella sp. JEL0407]|nr:hypothetical protein HK098_006678 [Nowakowskiella sp. JEL0407]
MYVDVTFLIFGDAPENIFTYKCELSQQISDIQQEIYETYVFSSIRPGIRPSDLILYNVLEELTVDDPRLDPHCIALYCQNEGMSLQNTLENFFVVRQCDATDTVAMLQRVGEELKNVNVLILVLGYEIMTHSFYETLQPLTSPPDSNDPERRRFADYASGKPGCSIY